MHSLLLAALVSSPAKAAKPPTLEQVFADLAWLSGDWVAESGGARHVAHYTSPEGGMILGLTRTLKDGVVVAHEFERFELSGGTIVYTPYPGGVASDPFPMVKSELNLGRIAFANPAHEGFPTEFLWERAGDVLTVTLSERARGSTETVVFVFCRP